MVVICPCKYQHPRGDENARLRSSGGRPGCVAPKQKVQCTIYQQYSSTTRQHNTADIHSTHAERWSAEGGQMVVILTHRGTAELTGRSVEACRRSADACMRRASAPPTTSRRTWRRRGRSAPKARRSSPTRRLDFARGRGADARPSRFHEGNATPCFVSQSDASGMIFTVGFSV